MVRIKKALMTTVAVTLLAFLLVSSAHAQTATGTLTVTATQSPNIVTLSGSGYDPSATVTLGLYFADGVTEVAALPNSMTDSQGNFSVNVTLPPVYETAIYVFEANTTNVTGSQSCVLYSPSDQQTGAGSSGGPTIEISPDDSNIFNITGTGFEASATVSLELNQNQTAGTPAYIFPEQLTTDSQGNFSAVEIVPTTISGTYTLIASTSSSSASTTVTIPNLTGATGATGAGATVAPAATSTGTSGQTGSATDTSLVYISIAFSIGLSIVSLAVAALSLSRKRSTVTA
jgi:hypothetical protein